MPDLHGWITQQIDRREDLAKRAAHYGRLDWPQPATAVVDVGDSWPITTEAGPIAEHIADNDPAAVLRRCTADRKILEVHAPVGGACDGCAFDRDDGYFVDCINDCPTLLALAEGYGLTPEILATLDQPETPARPERPDIPPPVHLNAIVKLLSARPTSSVPPALRGPNWKAQS